MPKPFSKSFKKIKKIVPSGDKLIKKFLVKAEYLLSKKIDREREVCLFCDFYKHKKLNTEVQIVKILAGFRFGNLII